MMACCFHVKPASRIHKSTFKMCLVTVAMPNDKHSVEEVMVCHIKTKEHDSNSGSLETIPQSCQKCLSLVCVSDHFTTTFFFVLSPFPSRNTILSRSVGFAPRNLSCYLPQGDNWLLTAAGNESREPAIYTISLLSQKSPSLYFFFSFFWRGRGSPPPVPDVDGRFNTGLTLMHHRFLSLFSPPSIIAK